MVKLAINLWQFFLHRKNYYKCMSIFTKLYFFTIVADILLLIWICLTFTIRHGNFYHNIFLRDIGEHEHVVSCLLL